MDCLAAAGCHLRWHQIHLQPSLIDHSRLLRFQCRLVLFLKADSTSLLRAERAEPSFGSFPAFSPALPAASASPCARFAREKGEVQNDRPGDGG